MPATATATATNSPFRRCPVRRCCSRPPWCGVLVVTWLRAYPAPLLGLIEAASAAIVPQV